MTTKGQVLVTALLVLGLAGAWSLPAAAQQAAATGFVYQPPLRGAPAASSRVGGGVRGTDGEEVTLGVLVPDHVALASSAQPTLYWFVTAPVRTEVEMTVVRPGVAEPVLDIWLDAPLAAGIHALRLADHGVKLEPGVEYRWYVALVNDRDSRSSDVVAGGEVAVQPADAALAARVAAAGAGQQAALYAGAGYWYDALEGLSAQVATGASAARRQRASLLEQVGLQVAADWERRAVQ